MPRRYAYRLGPLISGEAGRGVAAALAVSRHLEAGRSSDVAGDGTPGARA